MARRRAQQAAGGSGPVLPRRLTVFTGAGGDAYGAFWREQRAWLVAHGIDPTDWNRVRAVLAASRECHGLPKPPERRLIVQDDEPRGMPPGDPAPKNRGEGASQSGDQPTLRRAAGQRVVPWERP